MKVSNKHLTYIRKKVLIAQTKKIAFTYNLLKKTNAGSVYHKVMRIEMLKRKKS